MQVSEKIERLLDHFGKALTPDGLSLVQRLFAEGTWKAGRTYGETPGDVLLIRAETRPLTDSDEAMLRGWMD